MNKKISFPMAIIIILAVIVIGILFIILLWSKYTGHYNAEIKAELSEIKVAAQEYNIENGSYIGFTSDLIPPKCSDENYTIQISPDGKHYVSYARLCWSNTRLLQSKRDAFWCIDSIGFSGELTLKSIPPDVYSCSLEKVVPADETADWKTYRNEEYGFEIKYPNDFECKDYSYKEPKTDLFIFHRSCQGFFIKDSPYEGEKFMLSGVAVYANKEMLSLFDWIVKNKLKNIPITFEYTSLAEGEITITPIRGQTITISEIITNNYRGIRIKDIIEGGFSDEVYFIKKDMVYKVGRADFFTMPIYQETFNQMLSTFRFLE